MDVEQAKHRLRVHTGAEPGPDGFLTMLRPYTGLRAEVFLDLGSAVLAVLPELQESKVDRTVVSDLHAVCFFAHYWGVRPDGMLQSNGLLGEEDVTRLRDWADAVGLAVALSLDGHAAEGAHSLRQALAVA